MQGYELRDERRASGLTLAAVSRAAGTSTTNVSAYERGSKRPNPATTTRLLAAIRAGAGSAIHRERLLTVPAAAAGIRSGLRAGWATVDLLRIVKQLRSESARIVTGLDWDAFSSKPSTTGDRRWDMMLAGLTEMVALESGREVPSWSRGDELGTLWFVGDWHGLDAYSFAHTPPSLAVRGVVLDGANLVSV